MDITSFYESQEMMIAIHYEALKMMLDDVGVQDPEGNCFYYHQTTTEFPQLVIKRANLLYYARGTKKVCEIGLNAGHSAILFQLAASPTAQFTYFDLCEHVYAEHAFAYLQRHFPHATLRLEKGDSRITIPRHIALNPDEKGTYDLVHVDGGHTYPCFISDVECGMQLAKVGGIVVIDDTQVDFISDWIKQAAAEGRVEVLEHQLQTIGYMHMIVRRLK